MKSALYISMFAMFFFSLHSCKKEGCTDSTATNFDNEAKKDDGSCTYPVDPRDQYLGTYTVTDSAFGSGGSTFVSTTTYSLVVAKNTSLGDTLYLNNLINSGKNFRAMLSGNSFSIPSQDFDGSPYLIYGNGSFDSNGISYTTHTGPGGNFINEGVGTK